MSMSCIFFSNGSHLIFLRFSVQELTLPAIGQCSDLFIVLIQSVLTNKPKSSLKIQLHY